MERWYQQQELDPRAKITVSATGYTNDEISLAWLKHFHEHTRPISQKRLLILDGHGSHHTIEFIEFCEAHDIIPFGLPPHLTHILLSDKAVDLGSPRAQEKQRNLRPGTEVRLIIKEGIFFLYHRMDNNTSMEYTSNWNRVTRHLQPLDVVVFQPLKHYHAKALDIMVRDGVTNITKLEFLGCIEAVGKQAFKTSTIKDANHSIQSTECLRCVELTWSTACLSIVDQLPIKLS